jgi:hypothetical protein
MSEHTTLLEELETVELDKADQIALKDILHATSWKEEESEQFKYFIQNNE